MSKSAFSLFIYSIYLLVVGLVLITIPNLFFSMVGFPETQEVWIRIVGAMMLIMVYFNIMAIRSQMKLFISWTIHARFFMPAFIVVFVLLGYGPPLLLLFSAIDVFSGIWTSVSLRSEV